MSTKPKTTESKLLPRKEAVSVFEGRSNQASIIEQHSSAKGSSNTGRLSIPGGCGGLRRK